MLHAWLASGSLEEQGAGSLAPLIQSAFAFNSRADRSLLLNRRVLLPIKGAVLASFFRFVAERPAPDGDQTLLNLGCGPAPLAISLAPNVRNCVCVDPQTVMIVTAMAAAETGVPLTLHLGCMKDSIASLRFDIVTIGRALH